MLILPDCNIPRAKLLPAIPYCEWAPSQARRKDEFGNEDGATRFHITATLNDGHVLWRGWFDDRADADEFIWAVARGTLIQDRFVQRLPQPEWNPALWEVPALYTVTSTRSLTGTSASNQTDTVPSSWNSSNNFIDCIASGGSGGACVEDTGTASGGSGGAWSRQTNVSLTPGGSATYRLSAGGSAASNGNGNAGADCWYNGTTLAGASVGAKGGLGGNRGAAGVNSNGVAGGASASGVGSSKNSGGASGNATTTLVTAISGGGGAATSAGNGGASTAATDNVTSGGANGSGVAGGAANSNGNGTNGTAGTEYGSVGGGSGGGASKAVSTNSTAGSGGLYGAGGGGVGVVAPFVATSGAGRQALIFMSWVLAQAIPPFRRSTRFFTRRF